MMKASTISVSYTHLDVYKRQEERRKPGKNCIEIRGAKENNLQNVNVKFPIGLFNVVKMCIRDRVRIH